MVNAILLAFLFLSISFNKEYLRPALAGNPILNVFTGSYANFIAAYMISLFPACLIHTKRFSNAKGMIIILATAIGVFIILTIEEFAPVFGASKVRDGYDIVASAFGSSCAVLRYIGPEWLVGQTSWSPESGLIGVLVTLTIVGVMAFITGKMARKTA